MYHSKYHYLSSTLRFFPQILRQYKQILPYFGLKHFPNLIFILRWMPYKTYDEICCPQISGLVFRITKKPGIPWNKLTLSSKLVLILRTTIISVSYVHTINMNPKNVKKPSYLELSIHLTKMTSNFETSYGKIDLRTIYPRLLTLITRLILN